jgi:ATPase subunit of ABC transporter with duplicated ATPase domains
VLAQVPRILELSGAGLRSYGGNYADYQTQRDAEQQAAARRWSTRRRSANVPARMQKSMTTASGGRQKHYAPSIPSISHRSNASNIKARQRSVLAAGKSSITSKMMP